MKKLINALCLIAIITTFVACQKENSNPAPADINGTWTFISMDVNTISSQEYNDGLGNEKSVTTSQYTTENNTGTITIDASTMTSSNLSYSVNTTTKAQFYINGVLENTTEAPFNFNSPVSNGTSTYRTVSADSIYFESGTVFMNDVSQQAIPCGAKLSKDGNVLYITATVAQSTSEVIAGIPIKMDVTATSKVKLQRQ